MITILNLFLVFIFTIHSETTEKKAADYKRASELAKSIGIKSKDFKVISISEQSSEAEFKLMHPEVIYGISIPAQSTVSLDSIGQPTEIISGEGNIVASGFPCASVRVLGKKLDECVLAANHKYKTYEFIKGTKVIFFNSGGKDVPGRVHGRLKVKGETVGEEGEIMNLHNGTATKKTVPDAGD